MVDDSAFMRIAVKRTLESDPAIEVIGQGKDGVEAVQLVEQLQPEVVTMDFNMPRMNGIEALRAIVTKRPGPVVMLSAHTQEGAKETLEALALPRPETAVSGHARAEAASMRRGISSSSPKDV